MSELYDWIRNIVIYMILNTIIMNLLGNSSYKKYISIVSGMLLVLIVVSPLIKLLKIDDQLDYFFDSNNFAIETGDFKNKLHQIEGEQQDAIFNEYTEKIKAQINTLLAEEDLSAQSIDIMIDKDQNSETFGGLLQINITAGVRDQAPREESDIGRIDINKISFEETEKSKDYVPSPTEINIKNRLSDFYNIEPDNINISIQGG